MHASRVFHLLVCLLFVAAAHSARAAGPAAPAPPRSLEARAMTILRENCTTCHNAEKKKGKLLLTSREAALNGGESGAAIVPRNVAKSPLAMLIAEDADPHMPPKGQLTPDEIATLKAWIEAGAEWDAVAMSSAKVATTRPIELRPLPTQYHPVLSLALSPDQTRLAAGRGDRILIYDVVAKDRPLIHQLATPNDLVQSLAWSPDGQRLASGGFRAIRVWDLHSDNALREIKGLSGRVTALTFAPDGKSLIAADGEVASTGMIRIWRMPDGEPLASWAAHDDSILSIDVSRDGKLLATAGADRVAKIWDLATHKEIAKLEGHAGPVVAVALTADAAQLASAGMDKEIKVWDVKTREQVVALTTSPGAVTGLAWVDAKTLLSASEDGVPRFSSRENKTRAVKTFPAAPDVLYATAVTSDGKTIFGACHDGQIYVWSAGNTKLEGTLPLQGVK
jgi:WD40 repeat protein